MCTENVFKTIFFVENNAMEFLKKSYVTLTEKANLKNPSKNHEYFLSHKNKNGNPRAHSMPT